MASTASISGLASGMDTAAFIDQLLSLEAVPQTKLKTQVGTEEKRVSALQAINTALASLATSAKALTSTSVLDPSTWNTLKTTSSSSLITASATASAAIGTLSVSVQNVASAAKVSAVGSDLDLSAAATFTLYGPDGTTPLEDADGNVLTFSTDAGADLAQFASRLNALTSKSGIAATVVHGSSGDVLQLTSTKTGVSSNFSVSDGTQTLAASNGGDGKITVNGVTITSSSNTYANVVDGVTLTVASSADATTTGSVVVERDAKGRSDAIKGLVDSINSVLSSIATQSAINSEDTSKSGVLAGNSTVRSVSDALLNALYPEDELTSMAQFGLQLTKDGKFTFDADKFAEAYASDPDALTDAFVGEGGFAERVQTVASAASDKFDGYVTSAITGTKANIGRLNDSIEAWDTRLAMRRTTLERQFTAMETALSQLQSQGNWLASQIAGLPKANN